MFGGGAAAQAYGDSLRLATWQSLAIGGGGFVTGISIAPDGTKAVRTDTYGGYVWNVAKSKWDQILTSTSMPSGSWDINTNATGLYEIVVCPSLATRLYMMPADGFVYRSDNSGATWSKCAGFAQIAGIAPNATNRLMGRFMAVDPQNPDVLYVGTPNSGVFVTSNGGTTFSTVPTVGSSTTGNNSLIAFDPSSSVVSSKKQGIYISTYGTGVYRSTDGGATWALVTGTPTTHKHMIVDQNGVLYHTDNVGGASGNLRKLSAGTWTFPATNPGNNNTWHGIAVDPANANHVCVTSSGGFLIVSLDGFATVNAVSPSFDTTILNGDQPWAAISHVSNPSLSTADIAYDPNQAGILYYAMGYGVLRANPTASASALTMTPQSMGIEQLVAVTVLAPPGSSNIICGSEDFMVQYKPSGTFNQNLDFLRPTYSSTPFAVLTIGFSFDYVPGTPSTVVGLISGGVIESFGTDFSGISTDGGNTWTKFAASPATIATQGGGGNIACSSASAIVMVPQGSVPYFSSNGGGSWTASTGITGALVGASATISNILGADKVNIGTFYAFQANTGLYKSTNNGSSWTLGAVDPDTAHTGFSMILKVSPTVAGDMFYTPGWRGGGVAHPQNQLLYRSTDGGATLNPVTGFKEVIAIGYGAIFNGQTKPSIAAVGWFNNVFGIWQSIDDGLTWQSIGDYPEGNFQFLRAIDGDKVVPGRWYTAHDGSGFKYRTP